MEIITLVSWLTGFLIAFISLIYTVRHFRIQKTTSYIERLNNPEMARVRTAINEWLDKPDSEIEKYKTVKEDKHLEMQLKIFFDVFTELGIAYKYRSVSRKLTREIFFPMIPIYWKKLQFYIYIERLKKKKVGYWFKYLANEIDRFEKRNNKLMSKRYKEPESYYSIENESFVSIQNLRTILNRENLLKNIGEKSESTVQNDNKS